MMRRMAMHVAGVTLLGPTEALGAARSVVEWSGRAVTAAVRLPDRVTALLDGVEMLISRIDDLSKRADELVTRVDAIAEAAGQAVVHANAVADGASAVIDRADLIADDAGRVATTASEVVSQTSRTGDGARDLLEELPGLVRRLEVEIVPVLTTLDQVGPDTHEILRVVKDLRLAVHDIPGLGPV
jgi:ABC-type transporter Mla subunit MlaD